MNNSFPKNQNQAAFSGKQNQSFDAAQNKPIPTISAVLQDNSILETVYKPDSKKTEFILWKDGKWEYKKDFIINETQRIVPYSPRNNLIQNEVILFPSQPEEYGSEESLILEIQSFIHKYVDVSPIFEKIATYYVLFSWIYDNFHELPYLRLKGSPGSGKTRFLLTVGSVCYKPIFSSGASTISPIFRILDSFKGTLIIDESDFRVSDEKAEMTKILNQGNVKGFPILRSEPSPETKEYNPRAYHVFGPKIIATRGFFEDKALESRLFTEETGQKRLRNDIPINLPDIHKEEALHLRNKLLLFRFRNLKRKRISDDLVDRSIEPRLNQIFMPLLSIIEDENTRNDIQELARTYNQQMIADRGMDIEAQVLEILKDLSDSKESMPSVKEITNAFNELHEEEYDRKLTPKFIGNIIRTQLAIKTKKSTGVFIIPASEQPKIKVLYEKYGITDPVTQQAMPTGRQAMTGASPQSPSSPQTPPVSPNQAMTEDSQSPHVSPNQEPYLIDE